MTNERFVDGVFEGGGVKGIGLVGAAAAIEDQGYRWQNVAGTSAGAIVASLLAAGYTAQELKIILDTLDFNRFKDSDLLTKIPFAGPFLSLITSKGIYNGDFFEHWISRLLSAKGIRTFGDLVLKDATDPRYRYKLNVITSDVTTGHLVVLPQGIARYGLDPDRFPVAKAVRMSMSIPFFFKPARIGSVEFVDGGVLSNFPVWLFDSPDLPEWPTFGFKFVEPREGEPNETSGLVSFSKAIMSTMMEAHDKLHIENEDFLRTIAIPTLGVHTTEFDLSDEKKNLLYQSGIRAAEIFLSTWNFEEYTDLYRRSRNPAYVRKVSLSLKSMFGAPPPPAPRPAQARFAA